MQVNEVRLIDADKLKKIITEEHTLWPCTGVCATIDREETVDAVPVVHGHWTREYDCSECGMPAPTDDRIDFIDIVELKFCPYCGAKIDENEWAEEEETD